MKYYSSCKIPVENFFGFLSERDYSYLLTEIKALSDKERDFLDEVFLNIFYEYCYLSNDSTLLTSFKKEIYIEYVQGKINAITKILELYEKFEDITILELLNGLDVPFNSSKKIEPQIKKAIRKVKGLRNRYNITISKDKNRKDKVGKKDFKIDEQALNIELALGLKYSIDISTCTLSKWVSMIKTVKNRKNNG